MKMNKQIMAMLMIDDSDANRCEGMCKVMRDQKHHSPIFETGQARRVIKAIKDECQPDDDIAAMEMETKVAKIKLNKERNPKKLIEKMANIKVLYGMPIDDKR